MFGTWGNELPSGVEVCAVQLPEIDERKTRAGLLRRCPKARIASPPPDVQRAIDFYTTHLGFTLEHKQLPAFAAVSLDGLTLLLSGPGASGSRPMPDGHRQEPGGWNRIVLRVKAVARESEVLKTAGLRFRNEMESGPGGRQIQIEDPDGNPIELFEPVGERR